MGYILITVAVVLGLTVAKLATETASEYFAQYVAEQEPEDLGASEAYVAPELPVAVSSGSELPRPPSSPVIEPIWPVLLAAAAAEASFAEGVSGSLAGATSLDTVPDPAGSGGAAAPELGAAAPETPDAAFDLNGAEAQALLGLVRDTPYRRPDGTVFLPIVTQRLFSMRSTVTQEATVPFSYEIPGRIVTSAATGTIVPASRAGVMESADGKFPYLGMAVRKGDLLAYLRPTIEVAERVQIEARIQQLASLIALSKKQIERLKEVLFVRYRANKIESLEVQIDGYRRELASLQTAFEGRQELRASTDGIISAVHVGMGETVDQSEPLFHIVDPTELWVEAAAYDPQIAVQISGADAVTTEGRPLVLEFVGGGLALSNQAIPLRFRIAGDASGLSVSQPVTVIVHSAREVRGIPVPASSILRDTDGRSLVWERRGAEVFASRYVEVRRLAGDRSIVLSGLSGGLRVVTEGAQILSQVR